MLLAFTVKLPAVTSGKHFFVFFYFWLKWFHFLSDQSCQQTVRRGKEKRTTLGMKQSLSICLSVHIHGNHGHKGSRERSLRPAASLHLDSTWAKVTLTDAEILAKADVRWAKREKCSRPRLIASMNVHQGCRWEEQAEVLSAFRAFRLRSYPLELRAFLCRPLTDRK